MKTLLAITLLLGTIAGIIVAQAGYCTTQCYGSGTYRTCNTWCN